MNHPFSTRLLSVLLVLVLLLSCFPVGAAAQENSDETAAPIPTDSRAAQTLAQRAAELKAKINSLSPANSNMNAMVDLSGFGTTAGSPIIGLQGNYYIASVPTTEGAPSYVMDGAWADTATKSGAIPTVEASIQSFSLQGAVTASAFTLIYTGFFEDQARHAVRSQKKFHLSPVSNSTDTGLKTDTSVSTAPYLIFSTGAAPSQAQVSAAPVSGSSRQLKLAGSGSSYSYQWEAVSQGDPVQLFRIWDTTVLSKALKHAAVLLDTPDSYIAEEYDTFLTTLSEALDMYDTYNNAPTKMLPAGEYPQEIMERMAWDLEGYHTLLDRSLSYIDIPVEIFDFRTDGYLFENTINYAFRYDKRDADIPELAGSVAKDIAKRFEKLPLLPGALRKPYSNKNNASNLRQGLTLPSLLGDTLVYHPDTIIFLAHSLCLKESVLPPAVAAYVPGRVSPLDDFIKENIYRPYNKEGVTEAQKTAILGSWEQTLNDKLGGVNGNPLLWSEVETAHDLAYYMLHYLWKIVPEDDTFHTEAAPDRTDPNLVDQSNNRYNKHVPQRDTLRLYGNSEGVYTMTSYDKVGYSGRYTFNLQTDSDIIKISHPNFAPIDGLGFEEQGVLKNHYDTDPSATRMIIENKDCYDANYNFSMHASGSFIYYADQDLYFEFTGDDDVYFFIDGDLAVDLGSSHAPKDGSMQLNDFRKQDGTALVNGQVYSFDMFYTERATGDSNFAFTTNIKLFDPDATTSKGQYLLTHNGESQVGNTGFGTELAENSEVSIGDTVAYSFELLNTRPQPLTNVSFTDNTLGVDISKDSIKLCDPTDNYALTKGAKTEITDLMVVYRSYDAQSGVDRSAPELLGYSTMKQRLEAANTAANGMITDFSPLSPGSYRIKLSSEAELKALLEIGIPMNCQMIVYGFKRNMVKTDLFYKNTLTSLAYYRRFNVEGELYGSPVSVSGTAERSIRVPDVESIARPTAEAERYVIDYNKPLQISIEDLTKHVYSNRKVTVGKLLGFSLTGPNGGLPPYIPTDLACDKPTGSKDLETPCGTVTRNGDTLTYTLNGFLSQIDRFYAAIELDGMYYLSNGQQKEYPCIMVELQIIPAATMYYEPNGAAREFTNEDSFCDYLFFDFRNDPLDQERYSTGLYGGINFDDGETVHWRGNSGVRAITMDPTKEGAMVIDAATNIPSVAVDTVARSYSNTDQPLHYKFSGKDKLIYRFKMKGFALATGSNPYVSLHSYQDGTPRIPNSTKSQYTFSKNYLNNDTYLYVSYDLNAANYDYSYLSRIRLYFGNIKNLSEDQPGQLTIDYIYIGPEDSFPMDEHLYFDFEDRPVDRLRYSAGIYGAPKYSDNYDTEAWRARQSTSTSTYPSFDTDAGTMSFTIPSETVLQNNSYHTYVQLGTSIPTKFPLQFTPAKAEKLSVRFKLENLKVTTAVDANGNAYAPRLRLAYYQNDARAEVDDVRNAATTLLFDEANNIDCFTGDFVTLTVDTSSAFRSCSRISTIRLLFMGLSIKDPDLGPGKITIDTIFIGSEKDLTRVEPYYGQFWQTVTDGTEQEGEYQQSDFVNRTVYDINESKDAQCFFVDFDNTAADQTRYSAAAYNGQNPDEIACWYNSVKLQKHEINNDSGLMILTAKDKLDQSDYPDVYQSLYDLNFDPSHAEVFQIRFKMENFVRRTSSGFYVELQYNYGNHTGTTKSWLRGVVIDWERDIEEKYLTNGQFVTMTVALKDAFRQAGTIHSIRPYIAGIASSGIEGADPGVMSIDYIYIGPRDRTPVDTVYGYDPSYDNDPLLSDGSSLYVEGAGIRLNGTEGIFTESSFSFTGTGFDIISRTGMDQGTIRTTVYSDPERTKVVKSLTVNNKGELELYQIPVVSIQGLPHGTYFVTVGVNKKIEGSPMGLLDRGNQFYFDALRIYDPIDTNQDADTYRVYKLDKEANDYIKEIRNILLSSEEFEALFGSQNGAVFIDAHKKGEGTYIDPETGEEKPIYDQEISINDHYAMNVQTYNKVGPKNEVYLDAKQAVAFRIDFNKGQLPVSLDIGAKTICDTEVQLVAGIVSSPDDPSSVLQVTNRKQVSLKTSTSMYYPMNFTSSQITSIDHDGNETIDERYCYIVLYNPGSGTDRSGEDVVSITDIKVAYERPAGSDLPEDSIGDTEIQMRSATVEAPVSFSVDSSTAEAAAVFLRGEMELPLLPSDAKLSHSLQLESSIILNYALAKSAVEGYDSLYLQVKLPKYEGSKLTAYETLTLQPEDHGSYYYFPLTALTAVNMTDELEATLYLQKDGRTYATEADLYSIAQYAYRQLRKEGSSSALKTLCADLLQYGAKAQLFKGYRTDSLADAALTSEQRSYLTDLSTVPFGSTNEILEDLPNAPIAWVGKSLDLQSRVSLKYIFALSSYEGALTDLSLHVSYTDLNGKLCTAVLTELEEYDPTAGRYAFTFSALRAAELRSIVSAQVYAGSTPVSPTLRYSPATYGANKEGTLATLCRALLAYSDSANTFFKS
ncbi:MAG: fibro-slime domain-containing protein [Oscillospiraceae bacterium]|nr:fibro-slime domain-containing protein [Oscillospiraceae bacterium]